MALQSEEDVHVFLLLQIKGRVSWEERGQQLPVCHYSPAVRQHKTNQVQCFSGGSHGSGPWCASVLQQLKPFQTFLQSLLEMKAVSSIKLCVKTTAKQSFANSHFYHDLQCGTGQEGEPEPRQRG